MSRAEELINRISEIGYYGQHDDYGNKADKDQDAKEYMAPFDDLELPDGSKGIGSDGDKDRQTKARKTKDEKPGKKVD